MSPKFLWNGIKIGKSLYKGRFFDCEYKGAKGVLFRACCWGEYIPRQLFTVANGTDVLSGDYDKDKIFFEPGAIYYEQARCAANAYAKRLEKN